MLHYQGKLKEVLAYLFIPLLMVSFLGEAIENSIVPQMEKFENLRNLPTAKYSQGQFSEITSALERKGECFRVASYNVLFNLYDHTLDEVNRWSQRLPRIVELIDEMKPDIIGVQELHLDQLEDLLPHVEGQFAFYRNCEDGNGIFYRKERFEVMDHHVWFMTKTPNVPSSGALTMLQLKDRLTGKCVAVFTTHLAFSNIEKRDFQARFIAQHIAMFAKKMQVILTGDMNIFPNRLDLEKLPFYDGDYIHRILTKEHLHDAKEISLLGHLGPLSTFSNACNDSIPFKGTGTPGVFLDHIYVSKEVTVIMHAVQPGTVDGHFPSDHLPILIDCLID